MAGETELERIVVRLVGDAGSFVKMMTGATQATQAGVTKMITALNRLEGFANTLLGTFGRLGVAATLKGAFDQFAKMELGQIRLRAAIEGNNGNVDELTSRYTRVAQAISNVTLNTKGEVLALFQQADAQQFSGDAAENVVRNSIALAGATGQSAESMLRVAVNIQRGHPEFAARVLGLRGIRDQTELLNAVNQRLSLGMRVSQAEFNSASGRIERLGRSLKSVGTEVGGLIARALLPAVDYIQKLTEQFKAMDDATKKVVYQVVGLTLAWLGMGPVISVIRGITQPITSLAYYLGVTLPLTIANTVAWVAWKVVMLAFSFALGLVNSTFVVFKILSFACAAALSAFSLASTALTGVLGALSAGLTAVLTVGLIPILGTVGYIVIAIKALVAIAGTATTVFSQLAASGRDLYGAISRISLESTPLEHIKGLFSQWYDILKSVVRVAKTDMPLAWELLKAGADLAVNQVKDLWPPLWAYLRRGIGLFSDYIKTELVATIEYVTTRFKIEWAFALGGSMQEYQRALLLASYQRDVARGGASMALNAGLEGLRFQSPTASPDTLAAQNALQLMQAEANAIADAAEAVTPILESAGHTMGSAVAKGVHSELKKLDSVAYDSAEALSRIAEYQDRFFNVGSSGGGARGSGPAASTVGNGLTSGGAAAAASGAVVALLTRIANGIDRMSRVPAAPATADFTGV